MVGQLDTLARNILPTLPPQPSFLEGTYMASIPDWTLLSEGWRVRNEPPGSEGWVVGWVVGS